MATTTIETYLLIDKQFVPIAEFGGELPDKDYIEGAILCRIDGRDVLTRKHCDLIDQLWAYVVEGLGELREGRDFDTCFPDQPLRLRFERVSPHHVRVSVGDDSASFELGKFLSTMQRGAMQFFARMKELHPSASDVWERYEKEAKNLIR